MRMPGPEKEIYPDDSPLSAIKSKHDKLSVSLSFPKSVVQSSKGCEKKMFDYRDIEATKLVFVKRKM